jgi:flagellar biogenesis protein FliO
MRILRVPEQGETNTATSVAAPGVQGLVVWLFRLFRGLPFRGETVPRQLRLIETLSLGGKRQLMLVTCGGESFLVGGSFESIETIVCLRSELSQESLTKSLDNPCR